MPCTVIFHTSCHYTLMTVLWLLSQHQRGTCPSSPANEDLALAMMWLSPKAPGALCHVHPDSAALEPSPNCPLGNGKLPAAPIKAPVLLYEHWDGAGEPPSPDSCQDLILCRVQTVGGNHGCVCKPATDSLCCCSNAIKEEMKYCYPS